MGAKAKRARARIRQLNVTLEAQVRHAYEIKGELERVRYNLTRRVDALILQNETLARAAARFQRIERDLEHDRDIIITHRLSRMEIERCRKGGVEDMVAMCVYRAIHQIMKRDELGATP